VEHTLYPEMDPNLKSATYISNRASLIKEKTKKGNKYHFEILGINFDRHQLEIMSMENQRSRDAYVPII
jgi:hypothetical protein